MQAPPKFSSFRAKPVPPPKPEASSSTRDTTEDDKRRHHSRRHHESLKSHHKHRNSRRERSRSRSHCGDARSRHAKEPPTEVVFEQQDDIWDDGRDDPYVIDRRGDVDNIRYGYNNKYKVPDYRQPSLRKLLGSDGRYEDGRGARASLLSTLKQEDKQRLRAEPLYVRSGDDVLATELNHDFVTLNPSKKRKRKSPSDTRTIAGPFAIEDAIEDAESKGASASSSGDTSESSEDDEEEQQQQAGHVNADLRAKKIRLTRLVEDQPGSVDAWLEYIAFQASWMQQGHEVEEFRLRKEDKQSLAEVKLSIYKKALASIPRNVLRREILLIGMMEECDTVLEKTKLASKWREVVTDNPKYTRLGMRYIDFLQSNMAGCDYGDVVDAYIVYIGQVQQAQTTAIPPDYQCAILRATSFMSDAGYHERAVATWQAVLELCCFTSDADRDSSTEWNTVLSRFEEFWEDERARVGESGASGWRRSDTVADSPFVYPANVQREEASGVGLKSWLYSEREAGTFDQMPGRLIDDGDEGDDFHVVLFTDIQPFLPQKKPETGQTDLLENFLTFMRLPGIPCSNEEDTELDQYLKKDANTSQVGPDNSTFSSRMPCYRPTLQTLFDTNGDFQKSVVELAQRPTAVAMAGNILDLLVLRYPSWTELAEYYLAFILHSLPATLARKKAKSLIKLAPSNLRLYNAYAMIEMRSGKPDVAAHVLRTALGMSATLNETAWIDQIFLWYTYVSEPVLARDSDQALQRLCTIGQDGSILEEPATDVAGAETYLNAGRQRACDGRPIFPAGRYCSLLSMLYYVTSSNNISTGIEAFSTQSSILGSFDSSLLDLHGISTSSAIESLHQDRAKLIESHIAHSRPYKPAEVRSALQDSLSYFPTNTIFLNLYAQIEARFRIDDRVRQLAKDILRGPAALHHEAQTSSLVLHMFAIETEIRRSVNANAGSTRHAVRAAFERAVADKQSCHSATIWMLYLDYELSLHKADDVGRLKGEGARQIKDVFYRGLKCLPWVKMWYLKGVEILIDYGQEEEAREIVKMMEEKGLRMLVARE